MAKATKKQITPKKVDATSRSAKATLSHKKSPVQQATTAARPTDETNAMKETKATKVTKRGEKVDFCEVTHQVTNDKYKGFEGIILDHDKDYDEKAATVSFSCLKNARGTKPRQVLRIALPKKYVRELTHADMVEQMDSLDLEEESEEAIEYDLGQWECQKCEAMNWNDAGYCSAVVDGTICGGTKKLEAGEMKTWDGCFDCSKKEAEKYDWKCSVCLVVNGDEHPECIACCSPRSS